MYILYSSSKANDFAYHVLTNVLLEQFTRTQTLFGRPSIAFKQYRIRDRYTFPSENGNYVCDERDCVS